MARDFQPHPYQKIMLAHMLDHPRCAVWAGMGMGKTSSTLAYLDTLMLNGDVSVERPALVLAPLRVARSTWPNEAQKWEQFNHISVVPITGSHTERTLAMRQRAPVYSCNYENLPWLTERWGEAWPYRTVIGDEATRLKGLRLSERTSSTGKKFLAGQGGQRAKSLGRIAHTKIDKFIELTGTPSPNGLLDLWGCLWFLDAGVRLGRTFTGFKQRYFRSSYDGYGSVPLDSSQALIQQAIGDLCLTVDPADWFDIKQPITNTIYVDLPPKARQLYRDMEKKMFMKLEEHDVEAFNAAARTQKCLQIASGAAYVDDKGAWKEIHDEKIQALESIVAEANGTPVLVAYEFKSDRERILKAFGSRAVNLAKPDGFTQFLKGNTPVGIAHPKSMGHGIDGLQDVTNIIAFFSTNWNLEEHQQIIERIGPMRQLQSGHKRAVFIHRLVARDTVDEDVLERIESKREVQAILLDAMRRRHK